MTNPTDLAIQFALLAEAVSPAIVEDLGDTMYVGYCRPDCKSEDDPKWLIRRVQKTKLPDGGYVQTMLYANGVRKYNQRWSERGSVEYHL